ncbi:MAG: MFS transporter [Gammaproteobacteria bacterium]|nr:MFS transporter [Gammaproteobacteria bacterium]
MQDIEAESEQEQQSLTYAWYMVALCMVAYIFSFIDRQIITLLVDPIRADLQISDTQFSLLTGLAFALFYASMGIPIARLADTKSRPLIIAIGVFLWSLATAFCGLSRSFWQLFIARMAVGVGEAALSPAAYSMITDSFPKSKLGRALSIYSLGIPIGSGLAILIGGTIIDYITGFGIVELPVVGVLKPWQLTFIVVGLPGILVAALFSFTIRDPERKGKVRASGFSLREVGNYIAANKKLFFCHYAGFGFSALSMFAILFWAPAYLGRSYGLESSEIGLYLGLVMLVMVTSGVLSAGWLTDVFTRRGYEDAPMRAGLCGCIGTIIPAALFPFMPNLHLSLFMIGLALFFGNYSPPTSAAACQLMAPNQMRAQVTALFFLSMNVLGIAGGNILVALGTDYIFKDDMLVGYSMALMSCIGALTGALILAGGLKPFAATVKKINSTD